MYYDHAATHPIWPAVVESMLPWLKFCGNPSSAHTQGQAALAAVEESREVVAHFLGRPASGIVFTSGATEANHHWWYGVRRLGRTRAVTDPTSHPCVLAAAGRFGEEGGEVTSFGLSSGGVIDPQIPENCALASVTAVNHETGVIQPVEALIEAAAERDVWVHIDAAQSAGRVPINLEGAHGVVVSGHKIGGPVGIGVLSLPGGDPFPALLSGGGQERGRRSGTVPTALTVGMATACIEISRHRARHDAALEQTDRRLQEGLEGLGGRIIGRGGPRAKGIMMVVFEGLQSDGLVQSLDLVNVSVSAGAACASGSIGDSAVLRAIGERDARSGLRVSIDGRTEPDEVDAFLGHLGSTLARARA